MSCARLVVARSSHDFACCLREISIAVRNDCSAGAALEAAWASKSSPFNRCNSACNIAVPSARQTRRPRQASAGASSKRFMRPSAMAIKARQRSLMYSDPVAFNSA